MKSEAIFGYADPEVWNLLFLSVRHSITVSQFKISFRNHYISLAFHDVYDV